MRDCKLRCFALIAFLPLAIIPLPLLSQLYAEDLPGTGPPQIPIAHPRPRNGPPPISRGRARPVMESAGLAFAGTVQSVEHIPAAGENRISTTRVTFRVDTAIRGVRAGQTVVVSEWGALWSTGERYAKGERVCLLLYPPSKLGLTSPVHGSAGRFRLRGRGRVVVPPDRRELLPPSLVARIDPQGEIAVEDFARALHERSAP
ncbi:MAG TPA: hypothetical protein VF753_15150 [Terriglobales bacterium]